MKLVIEISYCDWECSGTSTYPIEYESAEQLLVDLEEFYRVGKVAFKQYHEAVDDWIKRSRNLGQKKLQKPSPEIGDWAYFKGCKSLGVDSLEDRMSDEPEFVAPEIYTLEEWFEKTQLKLDLG